jgi:acylpyruvate hydrolase
MTEPRFTTYLGMQVEPGEPGLATARLVLGPQHRNSRGVVHGGVVSALLDTALGSAVVNAIPKEWWCATTSLSVQYVDGATEGELVATGRVMRRGAKVAFAEGEVRGADGRLIATAQGSWYLWHHRPGEKRAATGPYVVVRGTGERLRVGKILAVGRNYAEHIAEMGGAKGSPPVLFMKPATAIVQDGGKVLVPPGEGDVHHEVELVVVIGKPGRAITEARALDHVLGYAVGLDMTLRDVQARAKEKGEPWAVAKGFDTSAPVSLVAPRAEVGDGAGLAIALKVNGATRQSATTSQMIHPVASLVALASRLITLEPGDLIFTGTPSGVGAVKPGDELEASLEKVGTLKVSVEAQP